MKKWWTFLPAYVPPLCILAFLLLANLLTRTEFFRRLALPERSITISARSPEGAGVTGAEERADSTDVAATDTAECRDSVFVAGRAHYAAGRYREALSSWAGLTDKEGCSRSSVYNSIGAAHMRLRALPDAERSFTSAIRADSTDALAWYNRALCASRRNMLPDAESDLQRAIRLDPGFSLAHVNLGVVLIRAHKYERALDAFREALALGADKGSCWYHIGLVSARLDSLLLARVAFGQSIRFEPGRADARLGLAQVWERLGNLDSASAYYEQARRVDPGNPTPVLRMCRILAEKKEYDRALVLIAELGRTVPDLVEVDYERARIYGLMGDDRRALELYRRIMARDPDNPRVYYNIGVNFMDLGRASDAVASYARALKCDPSYWKAAYNIGVYYLKSANPVEAIPYFERVIQSTPDRGEPYYNLGLAYLKCDSLTQAIRSFARAVSLDSTHLESRYNLALTLMKDGQADTAGTVFRSVLMRRQCHAKSLFNLGLLAKRAGNVDSAAALFQRAIACRNNSYPSAFYNLALCQRKQGDLGAALRSVDRSLAPADSDGTPVRALLLKAQLMDSLGMVDSARIVLARADAVAGDDPEALRQLLNSYGRNGELQRSRAVYSKLLRTDTASAATALAAAAVEEKCGSIDSAVGLYRRAVGIDDRNATAYLRLGTLLARSNKTADALAAIERAIQLDPAVVEPRVQRIVLLTTQNRVSERKREVDKLQRIATGWEPSLEAGRLLLRSGIYQDALMFLDQACRLAPDRPDPHYYRALCRTGMPGGAVNGLGEWQRFIEQFPANARGHYRTGLALLDRRDYAAARRQFLLAASPSGPPDALYYLAKTCLASGDLPCARSSIDQFLKENPTDRKGKALHESITKSSIR